MSLFYSEKILSLRNITFRAYNDFRKAISPFFSFHARRVSGSAASHSANALAFISRSDLGIDVGCIERGMAEPRTDGVNVHFRTHQVQAVVCLELFMSSNRQVAAV